MITVLVISAFLLGFGVCGLAVWFVQSQHLPGPGQHTGPMLAAPDVPPHPRYGPLLDTPPDGVEAVRPDGVIRVGAHERNVQPRRAPGHPPWTGSFPAVSEPPMARPYVHGEKPVATVLRQEAGR